MSKKRNKVFEIYSYEDCGDGYIIFWGKDGKIGARVDIDDILDNHPGETGYTPDFECDRANWYHIPARDLWDNGSDAGDPAAMVDVVWDEIEKIWIDEEGNFLNKDLRALQEHGFDVERVDGNLVTTMLYGIGGSEPDVFASLPRMLYIKNRGNNRIEVVFEIDE